jgi:hypothetical protein
MQLVTLGRAVAQDIMSNAHLTDDPAMMARSLRSIMAAGSSTQSAATATESHDQLTRDDRVLAALRERDRSGAGQVVSTSLLASQIALHAFQGTGWLVAGQVPGPSGNHHPTVAPTACSPPSPRLLSSPSATTRSGDGSLPWST